MVMKYLQNKKEKPKKNKKVRPPRWASTKDSTFNKAWKYVEEAKEVKALYIKKHFTVTDFSRKNNYLITGAEISKALSINRTSLMNTSKASPKFREYLEKINANLCEAKDNKLEEIRSDTSRGPERSSKAELVKANKELRKEVAELKAQKTAELVSQAFDELPLPVKRTLGIT